MAEELNERVPDNMFFQVTVEVDTETEKGIKKVKEIHLVDAVSPADVDAKVAQMMEGTMFSWRISSLSISKISVVY